MQENTALNGMNWQFCFDPTKAVDQGKLSAQDLEEKNTPSCVTSQSTTVKTVDC